MSEVAQDQAPVTLGERVYHDILQLIHQGPITVGTLLPTEAEFCKMFSVSRAVVRFALARLKAEGVIESRQGRGSIVILRPTHAQMQYPQPGHFAEIQKIYDFRCELEPGIAMLAARHRTETDINLISKSLETFQHAYSNGLCAIEEDLAFHLAIASATHNDFFHAAISALRPHFVRSIELSRKLSQSPAGTSQQKAFDEHRAIVDEIRRQDPDMARAAMNTHLANTRKRSFGGR